MIPFAVPNYLDLLRRRSAPFGFPQGNPYNPVPEQPMMGGPIPFEGGYSPGGYKGVPGTGGSGPMGFPNPLAPFRPFQSGANPMGRKGAGRIRPY